MGILTLVTLIVLMVCGSNGYRSYLSHIPNGDSVPDPCHTGYIWTGVGHDHAKGGGRLNSFGVDFKASRKQWTRELCMKDSDGDGKRNGEELGDPNCIWTVGSVPERPALSHPGYCTRMPCTSYPRCHGHFFHG